MAHGDGCHPVAGGNVNAYNYPNDPINFNDLDGKRKRRWVRIVSNYGNGSIRLNLKNWNGRVKINLKYTGGGNFGQFSVNQRMAGQDKEMTRANAGSRAVTMTFNPLGMVFYPTKGKWVTQSYDIKWDPAPFYNINGADHAMFETFSFTAYEWK